MATCSIDYEIAINDLNMKLSKKDEEIAKLKEQLDHAYDKVEGRVARAYARVHWLEEKTGIRVPNEIGTEERDLANAEYKEFLEWKNSKTGINEIE